MSVLDETSAEPPSDRIADANGAIKGHALPGVLDLHRHRTRTIARPDLCAILHCAAAYRRDIRFNCVMVPAVDVHVLLGKRDLRYSLHRGQRQKRSTLFNMPNSRVFRLGLSGRSRGLRDYCMAAVRWLCGVGAAGAGDPRRHRPLLQLRAPGDRSLQPRLRAAVSALDRRRQPSDAGSPLPPGTAIDASDPEAWVFPAGTRFWKEFAFGGRPGRDPLHRTPAGRRAGSTPPTSGAPDGRDGHARARHGAAAAPTPSAAAARTRSRRSATAGLPRVAAARPCSASACSSSRPTATRARCTPSHGQPRTSTSPYLVRGRAPRRAAGSRCSPRRRGSPRATPVERAALGYLHGNCGHCHNADGPLRNLGLFLRHVARRGPVAPASRRPSARRSASRRPASLRRPCSASTRATRIAAGWRSAWARAGRRCRCRRSAPTSWTSRRSTWSGNGSPGMEGLQAQTTGEGRKQ